MLNILKKELKDSFRDQRTLLLTVLLPLVLMSGLVFFNENLLSPYEEDVYEVAVQDAQYPLVQKLLADNENLHISAVDNVKETIEEGNAVAGIVIPADFEEKMAAGATPSVQILNDLNSQNSTLATSAIEASFMQYSQRIVTEQLAAQSIDTAILTPFTLEQVQIVEGDLTIIMLAFLIPLMLTLSVGLGLSTSAADLIAGEKERRTMEALLMTPVNHRSLLVAKWLTMVIIASMTGIITLTIVFVEIHFFTETLKAGISFGSNALPIALVSVSVIISYSAILASALMVTSIFAKTIKEAQTYSTPITMLTLLPSMLMYNVGINELTFTHFAVPVMNIFAVFKELFFGIVNIEHILTAITSNLLVALIIFIIGRVLFFRVKWVLAK
ncbi:ABC transporter permease [Cytobacillus gottheilii]|uniref:ABC transporter permease n=1 Tax=Cytobacillus gottheilii TaxID=859144 RepID=UPI00082A20AB|nr:ABC transporter permease subunit [Cytobacillus gottheilii]